MKTRQSSSNDSLESFNDYFLTREIYPFSFPTKGFFVELKDRIKGWTYLHYIYCKVKKKIHEEIKPYKCDQDVHVCTEWSDSIANSMSWIIPSFFIFNGYGLYSFFYMPYEHVAYLLWACIFYF